jgi:hypothetical protein
MKMGASLLMVFLTTLYKKKQTPKSEEKKYMPSCNVEWVNGHMKYGGMNRGVRNPNGKH